MTTYARTAAGIVFAGHFWLNDPYPQYITNQSVLASICFRIVSPTTLTAVLYSNASNSYKMVLNGGAVITLDPGTGNQFYTVDLAAAIAGAGQSFTTNNDIIIYTISNYTGVPSTGTFLTTDGTLSYFRDGAGIAFTSENYDIATVSPADTPAPVLKTWINFEGGSSDPLFSVPGAGNVWYCQEVGAGRLAGFRTRWNVTDYANFWLKFWGREFSTHYTVTWKNLSTLECGIYDFQAPFVASYTTRDWVTCVTPGTIALPRNGNYEFGIYKNEWSAGATFTVNNIASGGGTLIQTALPNRDMIGLGTGDSIFSEQGNFVDFGSSSLPWGIMWKLLVAAGKDYGFYQFAGNGLGNRYRGTDTTYGPPWSKVSQWTGLANPPKFQFVQEVTNDIWAAATTTGDAGNHISPIGTIGSGFPDVDWIANEYITLYSLINAYPNGTKVIRMEPLHRTDSPSNNDMETYVNTWNGTHIQYKFTVSGVSVYPVYGGGATGAATYTNNLQTFTVAINPQSGNTLYFTGTGAPTASGTLIKTGGTGDLTITFSASALSPFPKYSDFLAAIGAAVTQANADNITAGKTNQVSIITYARLVSVYGFDLAAQGSGFLHPSGSDLTVYTQMVNWMLYDGGVLSNLDAGTLSLVSKTTTSITASHSGTSGGTAPYANQWKYRVHGVGSYTNFGSGQGTETLSGLTANTQYDIKITVTDSLGNTADTPVLSPSTNPSSVGDPGKLSVSPGLHIGI